MEKLYEADRAKIIEYISDEPEYNLFIIGDIENFGVDSENVELFADVKDGSYGYVILRYRDSYIIYSRNEHYDAKTAAEFIKERKAEIISGKGSVVEKLAPYMADRKIKRTYLSKLTFTERSVNVTEFTVRALTPDDAKAVVELYIEIDEFKEDYKNNMERQIENIKINLQAGNGMGAFDKDRLIAAAVTSAENSMSAMIIGVATLPRYRKKGIASVLVSSLCQACLDKGMKFVCLFYNNPEAGSIYRKIGFKEMGEYIILK